MNVLEALIGVIPVQLATTLKGVTPALATLDTQEMGSFAQVTAAIFMTDSLYLVSSALGSSHIMMESATKAVTTQIAVMLTVLFTVSIHCKRYLVKMTMSEGYCSFRVH